MRKTLADCNDREFAARIERPVAAVRDANRRLASLLSRFDSLDERAHAIEIASEIQGLSDVGKVYARSMAAMDVEFIAEYTRISGIGKTRVTRLVDALAGLRAADLERIEATIRRESEADPETDSCTDGGTDVAPEIGVDELLGSLRDFEEANEAEPDPLIRLVGRVRKRGDELALFVSGTPFWVMIAASDVEGTRILEASDTSDPLVELRCRLSTKCSVVRETTVKTLLAQNRFEHLAQAYRLARKRAAAVRSRARLGSVPLLLRTPHQSSTIYNPTALGGNTPLAPWQGQLSKIGSAMLSDLVSLREGALSGSSYEREKDIWALPGEDFEVSKFLRDPIHLNHLYRPEPEPEPVPDPKPLPDLGPGLPEFGPLPLPPLPPEDRPWWEGPDLDDSIFPDWLEDLFDLPFSPKQFGLDFNWPF